MASPACDHWQIPTPIPAPPVSTNAAPHTSPPPPPEASPFSPPSSFHLLRALGIVWDQRGKFSLPWSMEPGLYPEGEVGFTRLMETQMMYSWPKNGLLGSADEKYFITDNKSYSAFPLCWMGWWLPLRWCYGQHPRITLPLRPAVHR